MRRTVAADLDANVAEATLHVLLHALFQFLVVAAGGVGVAIGRKAGFSTEQLINWHAGAFAFDVPKSHVEAGKRVVQDGAVAPIGTGVGVLPDVFDVIDVAAARERIEVFLEGIYDREGTLVEGGATESVKARFARFDFDDDEPASLRRSGNGADFFDRDWLRTTICLGGNLFQFLVALGEQIESCSAQCAE